MRSSVATSMSRNVIVVPPQVTLAVARRLMTEWKIRHLPVVDARRLVGILSDRDLLIHAAADDADLRIITCGEAMTPAPVTCSPATPVGEVAALMIEHKIDSVPVVSGTGALVGLVTSTDLLALLVERAEAQVLPFDFDLRVTATDGELAA